MRSGKGRNEEEKERENTREKDLLKKVKADVEGRGGGDSISGCYCCSKNKGKLFSRNCSFSILLCSIDYHHPFLSPSVLYCYSFLVTFLIPIFLFLFVCVFFFPVLYHDTHILQFSSLFFSLPLPFFLCVCFVYHLYLFFFFPLILSPRIFFIYFFSFLLFLSTFFFSPYQDAYFPPLPHFPRALFPSLILVIL